ncbi:hypothetical protein [Bacillus thuringiensis]|uniref:hypothetical protein n=1 Tax=Bacillus thuringiensis TaxID=1428 RepID=UPI000BFE2014|nr:hypothetical protein [Bacillus thuringiensis]PGT90040.1 hypothetical protein COD17_09835 [Bacillus thuringiensis]
MYTSMCLKDFKGFKKGEVFDTYERPNYAYVRNENNSTEGFIQLHTADYKNYFLYVSEYINVPRLAKKERRRFFKKVEYVEWLVEWYKFDLETKYLRLIQETIFLPIRSFEDDEEFLLQFSDSIHYALSSLEELTKMYRITDVDLESEILRVAEYFNELETLYNNVDKATRTPVTELLESHRDHMNRLISLMKEVNRA